MTSPTKAGEQSMEEILASIRKIIADDPNKASKETPVALGTSEASAQPGRPAASFGRLSEALRTTFASSPAGALPPTTSSDSKPPPAPPAAPGRAPNPSFASLGVKRESIDEELEDILKDPFSEATGRLDVGKGAGSEGAVATSQWAVWRTPQRDGSDSADGARANGDKLATPAPTPARPAPELGSTVPARSGFYPASGSFGARPTQFEPVSDGATPVGGKPEQPDRFEAKAPGETGGFGAVVPRRDGFMAAKSDAGPAKSSSIGSGAIGAPRFSPALPNEAPANSPPPPASEAKPARVVIAAMPAAGIGGNDDKRLGVPPAAPVQTPPNATAPPPASSEVPVADIAIKEPVADKTVTAAATASAQSAPSGSSTPSVPLPPRTTLFSRPFMSGGPGDAARPAPAAPDVFVPPPSRPSPMVATPNEPSIPRRPAASPLAAAQIAASTSALDALAAGLAASNASAVPAPATSVSAAAPVVHAAPVAPAVAAPEASLAAQHVRTLEDSVADMIKPMLQKWIDDNMPRIIEKALRNEVGQPGRGGSKPGA